MAAPRKKLKYPPTEPKTSGGTSGSPAELKRNKKGELKATLKSDFGGVTKKTIREDRSVAAKTGDRTFTGAPAPRGGKQKVIAKSGPLKSASKKVIRQSRRKPTGSPQARRSQKNNRF